MPALEVIDPGLGCTFQDRGRPNWRCYGVPKGGAMDEHAAHWANQLLDNHPNAPVLELLLQGARFRALRPVWIAITGANASSNFPTWRPFLLQEGETLSFPRNRSGVWIYLGIDTGFNAPVILGSASVYSRGMLGIPLRPGDLLDTQCAPQFKLPPGIASRALSWSERRDYDSPAALRVWPGPQWNAFNTDDRARFLGAEWTLSTQCDRIGYRLTGPLLSPVPSEIISEPVLPGSVQVPESGMPIVIMRDGPTVGGYPKIGWIDPPDLSRLAQCRPGQRIRFSLVPE